jgi:hypothetical protein
MPLSGGIVANDRALGGNLLSELHMLRREGIQHAAGEDRDGAAAGVHRAAVGGAIDAASHAAHDGQARAGESGGETLGLLLAIVRGAARADDGDGHLVGRFKRAAAKQHAGRVGDLT